jgi:CheY-like chemotaxis protein
MPKVFVIEPEPRMREWCRLHLATQGLDVTAFDDGRRALEAVRVDSPDLVVVSTDLPGFSAFALAAALRSNVRTALIPLLFLVAPDDVEASAQALAIEPTGVLSKPLTRTVLLEAVAGRVPVVPGAGGPLGSRASAYPAGAGGERAMASGPLLEVKQGTVQVVVLRNFVSLARAMTAQNLDRLLRQFWAAARESIFNQGGWIVSADATMMVSLFEEAPTLGRPHSVRATEAALGAVVAARRAKKWAESGLPRVLVPDLSVGCGVHSGEVIVARLSSSGQLAPSIAGQTVDLALRLDGRAKGLHWSVAASESTLMEGATRFLSGRRATLTDADHGVTLAISEVTGLNPGSARPGELPYMGEVREAVVANTLLARLASDADQFTADRTMVVTSRSREAEELFPALPERRVQRRLRQGTAVSAFIALHLPTDREELVKVIPAQAATTSFTASYLAEYRRLIGLEQRNVVTVHEVGQTPALVFVATEYVSGDSLADMLSRQVPVGVALNCVAQAALALDAVHQLGIVHGQLAPEHFKFRPDGGVVLTDFNVTARVCASLGISSPEDKTTWLQSDGADELRNATPRSDFKALGRILHALLTGETALLEGANKTSAEELTRASRLPLALSPLQTCLDSLLGLGSGAAVEQGEDLLVTLLETRNLFPFDMRPGEGDGARKFRKLG